MKKAFTLVEMLIVVALIATLMTIVLRLGAVSDTDSKKNKTVIRMAKLENCLSGYYAAYGNYPSVPLHNSRDIYQEVDGHGVQSSGEENKDIWGWTKIGESQELKAWKQVEGACRAQPVGAEFPFADDVADDVKELLQILQSNLQQGYYDDEISDSMRDAVSAGFDSLGGANANLGRFSGLTDETSWRKLQLFKFGLMSFLLPRYQLMLGADEDLYEFAQYADNNTRPRNPLTGKRYSGWHDLNEINKKIVKGSAQSSDLAELENIASEAACARWLPNLQGICATTLPHLYFYGVDVADDDTSMANIFQLSTDPEATFPSYLHFYSPQGDSTAQQYILDCLTVNDGWGNEYYYYSPSPYQSYQIWSSGENGRTFPPWISRTRLSAEQNKRVYMWAHDDIKGMNN